MSGAEPDKQTDDYTTSTFIAAQMGNFEIVKMLVEAKADKNMADATKASPLFIAAQCPGLHALEYKLPWSLCLMSFLNVLSQTRPLLLQVDATDKEQAKTNQSTCYQVPIGQGSTLQESFFFSNLFVLHAEERP